MSDALLRDRTTDHDNGAGTRTLTVDLPAPWVIHALVRSDAYLSHTAGNVTVDVALGTANGYATGMVVPTDGVPREDRSFEDYFSGGRDRVADKAAVTFRTDIHDADAVVPVVLKAVESIRPLYQDVTGESA